MKKTTAIEFLEKEIKETEEAFKAAAPYGNRDIANYAKGYINRLKAAIKGIKAIEEYKTAKAISDALACGYTTYVRYRDEKGNHCAKFGIDSYPHAVINNLLKVIDREIDSVEYRQSEGAVICIIICKGEAA